VQVPFLVTNPTGGFWEGSTDTIVNIRVTNLDSKSYKNLPPKKDLESQGKKELKEIFQSL